MLLASPDCHNTSVPGTRSVMWSADGGSRSGAGGGRTPPTRPTMAPPPPATAPPMATTNMKSDADADAGADADADADGPTHPPRADAHEHSADGPLRSSSILALLPDELLSRVLGFKIGSLRELTRLGTVSPAFRVARWVDGWSDGAHSRAHPRPAAVSQPPPPPPPPAAHDPLIATDTARNARTPTRTHARTRTQTRALTPGTTRRSRSP